MSDTRSSFQVPGRRSEGSADPGDEQNKAPEPAPEEEGAGEVTAWGYPAYGTAHPEPPAGPHGTAHPGDPAGDRPGTPRHGAPQPAPPHGARPSTPQYGTAQPGTPPHAAAQHGTAQSATARPGSSPEAQHSAAHSGTTHSGAAQPGTARRGGSRRRTSQPAGPPGEPEERRAAEPGSVIGRFEQTQTPDNGITEPDAPPGWHPAPYAGRDDEPSELWKRQEAFIRDRRSEGGQTPWPAPGPEHTGAPPVWERRRQPSPDDEGGHFSFWNEPDRAPEPRPAPQRTADGPEAPASPATATEDAPEPAAKRKREPYLDNVKFLLIALVPMGHALVPTLDADSARAAYIFIYTFHMPAFVVVSGYLSRNFWNSNAKTNKLVDTFLIPYAIVEVGYAVLRFSLGQKWSLTIIDPAWLNWYLLALLLWRLSTPVWKRMKQPLLVAVVIYLLSGFSEISGDFSFDRFFGLLPFFVLGLMLQPEHFDLLNRTWVKIVAGFTLVGGAGAAILLAERGVKLEPVYFKASYKDLDLSWWMGLSLRGALLVAALALTLSVLALVPRRETWFTDLGTRTLYAYLLHGIPVMIAKEMGWLSLPWLYGPLGMLAIMTSSFALAIVLCLPETRTVFKWVLEPRLTWLYRRPSGKSRTPRS
ncbi:acyltransferase family protein [Streptosporangium soli]|nr:acyltransferase family protein [Streptosporangium sp. KLBMP 9127]